VLFFCKTLLLELRDRELLFEFRAIFYFKNETKAFGDERISILLMQKTFQAFIEAETRYLISSLIAQISLF